MSDKVLDFKSKAAYKRYLKWGHSHDVHGNVIPKGSHKKDMFESTPGHKGVRIRGKTLREFAYGD